MCIGVVRTCRIGLRVVVDHDSLLALLLEREGGVHSTPIELDGATDTVDTRSENQDTMVVELDVMRARIISSIEIVLKKKTLATNSISKRRQKVTVFAGNSAASAFHT